MSENKKESEDKKPQEQAASKEQTAKTETKTSDKPKTSKKSKVKAGKKKVKIDCDNMAGKYLIAANRGQVIELEAKQADEIIAAKDGKEVK